MKKKSTKCPTCNEPMVLIGNGLMLADITTVQIVKLLFDSLSDNELNNLYFCSKCDSMKSIKSTPRKKKARC